MLAIAVDLSHQRMRSSRRREGIIRWGIEGDGIISKGEESDGLGGVT